MVFRQCFKGTSCFETAGEKVVRGRSLERANQDAPFAKEWSLVEQRTVTVLVSLLIFRKSLVEGRDAEKDAELAAWNNNDKLHFQKDDDIVATFRHKIVSLKIQACSQ